MGRRKRSLNQELADSGNIMVPIPRKVGMSAHGGLEYHRCLVQLFWNNTLSIRSTVQPTQPECMRA